jgi:hypothetical protein
MALRHDEGLPIRGVAPGAGRNPVRTYEEDRMCGHHGCGTRLSIYNRSERCWVHEPPKRYVMNTGGRPRKDRQVVAA